jgi:photosystem II stability/assembly factor-like uncharacterized protein
MQARWEPINLSYTGDLNDIFLLPNDTIMLLSRFDDTFRKTCIFESANGGRTWKQNCFDTINAGGFSNFYCFNHLKIFAGNYRTFDGGSNWKKEGIDGVPMCFFNDSIGFYVLGSSIYKTKDGGVTAKLVFDRQAYDGFSFVQFFDNRIGYASGGTSFDSFNSGIMVKTTDGGNSWQQLPKKFKSILGMSFITPDIGYIVINLHEGSVVGTYRSGSELLKTLDGGNTWKSINDKIYEEYNQIPFQCYFTDEQHGFLCGSKILSTNDGGKTWKEEYARPSSDYALNKMVFTAAGNGYAIGNNGLLLKRVLY